MPPVEAGTTAEAGGTTDRLRVAFCWGALSGYAAACFTELARRGRVQPKVICFASGRPGSEAGFRDELAAGFPAVLLEPDRRDDAAHVVEQVRAHRPDVVVVSGWFHPPYRRVVRELAAPGRAFCLAMDTPWTGSWRQRVAPPILRRYLTRFELAIVTGERCWQYARRLGFAEAAIRRGVYGVDHAGLSECLERRTAAGAWPRRFLFVGRYAPEKAPDVLLDGYRRYRRGAPGEPWPLVCCGTGPLRSTLAGAEGVGDRGFVQPEAMREEFAAAGALVLPSRFDPWPLALVEGCAAGLPVVCSEACGSAVELVRPFHNGFPVATGDAAALAAGLLRVHRLGEAGELEAYGRRSNELAAAYSAPRWADRAEAWLGEARERAGRP